MKRDRTPSASRRDGGFTLIEVMIALTLVSMLVTVLFASLRLASRASDAGDEADDRASEVFVVHDWLRRELAQAQPVIVRDDAGRPVVAFSGRAHALRFAAPLPSHLGGGGFSRIELILKDTADGWQLVMTAGAMASDAEPAPTAHRRILAQNLRTARFSYFGAREDGDEAHWQDQWLEMTRLPFLIRLSAQPMDDRRIWPPLVVRPMIGEAPNVGD